MVFLNCVRVQIYTMQTRIRKIIVWNPSLEDSIITLMKNIIFQPLSVRTVLSRFQKDNRWGTFWSVGANWRISQEKFMQNLTWISNLSAKISYGEQGNDNLLRYDSLEGGYVPDYYPWQGLYPLEYPNANQVGGLIGALENKKLSWEKSGNLNVGIEASMFDGRLNVSAEYYNRKTTDMLLGYPKATSSGFSEYNANIGFYA